MLLIVACDCEEFVALGAAQSEGVVSAEFGGSEDGVGAGCWVGCLPE